MDSTSVERWIAAQANSPPGASAVGSVTWKQATTYKQQFSE